MPQLDFHAFLTMTIYTSVILITLLYLIHTIFLPKISETLKLRNKFKVEEKKVSAEEFEEISLNLLNLPLSTNTIIEKIKNEK